MRTRGKRKRVRMPGGYILITSPHALDRIGERKGERKKEVFAAAAEKATRLFVEKIGVDGFCRVGSRVGIRSKKENVVVILELEEKKSGTDFVVTVVTVWNLENGEFYFRRGMTIYDVSFALSTGYSVTKAKRTSFVLQQKYVWQ